MIAWPGLMTLPPPSGATRMSPLSTHPLYPPIHPIQVNPTQFNPTQSKTSYRSYNLGLGARGQIALTAAEAWADIEPFCAAAIGRKDWNPEKGEQREQLYLDRPYKTQVIQRDRLVSG